MHFQQRASQWRESVRAFALTEGILPLNSWAGTIHPLDALRSSLNSSNGAALQYFTLARTLVREHPGLELELSDTLGGWNFVDAIQLLGPEKRMLRIHGSSKWRRWRSIAHQWAYDQKVNLQRRYWQSVRVARRQDSIDVLAVPRTPVHLADLLPLAEALRREARLETAFALVDNRLVDRVLQAGFDVYPLLPTTAGDRRTLRRELPAARETLLSLIRSDGFRPPGFDGVEHECLAKQTRQVVRGSLGYALHTAIGVRRLLDQLGPKVLLVGNPYTLEGRLAIQVTRCRKIPTTAVEHGAIFPTDPSWDECPLDKVFVRGEPSRRALLARGLSESQIAVTGGPSQDATFRDFFAQQARESATKRDVLVASSGPGGAVGYPRFQIFLQMIYAAADLTPEIEWTVKLHAKDREEFYSAVCPHGHPRVRIVRGDPERYGLDIYDYLKSARALVTITSSSALDAMAVDVPVIAVDVWPAGQGPQGIEFLDRGCTVRVRTAVELAEAVRLAGNGGHNSELSQAARDYASEHFVNRGRAASAIVQRMQDLIDHLSHSHLVKDS
jgi:hypothetical protein